MTDARKLLDETAKEKAHLQIEVGKWKAEADDLAAKLAKRDQEADALHKSLSDAEKKISVSCRYSTWLLFLLRYLSMFTLEMTSFNAPSRA